jgi:hypothetical protein
LTEAAPPAPARRPRRWPAIAAVLAAVVLLLYAARLMIARETVSAWLKSQGVQIAAAEVHTFGLTRVAGSLSIGDPRRPDFTAERAEVGYGLRGLRLEVRSVKLVRPVLRARLHQGRFSLGALDPLIESLLKGPPQPNAPKPRITVKGGRLLLDTDWGPLDVAADAAVADNRLQKLTARVAPARLRGKGLDLDLGPALVSVQAAGPRVELSLDAPISSASVAGASASNARLRVTAAAPYPDLTRRRVEGPIVAHAELSGGRLGYGGQALRNGLISAALTGQAAGGLADLTLSGRAVADLRAAGAEAAGGTAGAVRATASAEALRWTRKGGDALQAQVAATAGLDGYAGAVKLQQVTAAARGPASLAANRASFDLVVNAAGHGAWDGLGPPVAGDSAEIAAVKRAARGFRFDAQAVRLRGSGGAVSVRGLAPVRLIPDRGGAVALAPAGAGWRLTAAGGGLPRLDAQFDRVAAVPDGMTASGRIRAGLSLGPVQKGDFDAFGTLRLADGDVSFVGDRCARVAAARLDFGANDVTGFAGRFCPAGQPLIRMGRGDWRIAGRGEDVSGEVPFLQAKLARGAGLLDLGSTKGVLGGSLRIDAVEASDAAPTLRFRPVGVVGEARTARGLWTSNLAIRDRAGRPLATVKLHHADATGRGGLDVETGALHFAAGGLQPADLSPLAAAIGSPAEGEARFTGAMSWSSTTSTSSGVLQVPELAFQSPLGKVTGLSGRIAFSSLVPLIAPPGQILEAREIAAPIAPLTKARAVFALGADALAVSAAEAQVGGGAARIESLEVPLGQGRPIRGLVDLDGVQLHDLVEASPFGDRVDLDARVTGRIPFTLVDDKLRITGGALHAVQPGRLSIQRTALTGAETSGAGVAAPGAPVVPEPPTDTFSDFAYQAMENLAFTTLTASVDSRADGRLGVVFHIVGKHDPPQRQEIRMPLMDLIQKKFLGRKLPLPSGTGVDLTLDTTLNLDDLLADYAEFRRLHGSASVQP